MQYIIYPLSNENEYLEAYDSAYNVTITTDEEQAQKFTETEAVALIMNLDGDVDFWGSRPTRPR